MNAYKIAALSATFAASSCNDVPLAPDVATVSYSQVGACSGFKTPVNLVSAGPGAAFLAFRVSVINNAGSKIPFHFDPAKMFVDQSSRQFVDGNLALPPTPGAIRAQPVTAPAGASAVPVNGFAFTVVTTSNQDGAAEANQTSYFLLYDRGPGDPGVVMSKTNAHTLSFQNTEDCTDLVPAL